MISAKAIEYLERKFGVDSFGYDFDNTFQDVDDAELKTALRENPESYFDLLYILADMNSDDKEKESHLLEFPSWEKRQEENRKTKELQERMIFSGKHHE